jgi:hypothetical protein
MRYSLMYGCVRGAEGNLRSYRDYLLVYGIGHTARTIARTTSKKSFVH